MREIASFLFVNYYSTQTWYILTLHGVKGRGPLQCAGAEPLRPRVSGCADSAKKVLTKASVSLRHYRLWRFHTALRCIIITQLSVAFRSIFFARGSPPLCLPDKGPRPLTLCRMRVAFISDMVCSNSKKPPLFSGGFCCLVLLPCD